MPGMLMNYAYVGKDGVSYVGQVVADPTSTKYNYVAGQTYAAPGGSYTIGTSPGVPTTAPVGSVYQSSYTDATGKSYDTYHYDPRNNLYYDVKTQPYDTNTGTYQPPTPAGGAAPPPVPMWSTTQGLGSEYAYIAATPPAAGAQPTNLHVYGGGGTNAQITPSALGMQAYDYKFAYPDGSYYLGRVVDDGTYGYKVGESIPKAGGTYSIYATDPTAPPPTAMAGYTYTSLYHDATSNTNYAPSDVIPTSPYYTKPTGYGGMGSESDYVSKPGGYYKFDASTPSTASTAVPAVPLPT